MVEKHELIMTKWAFSKLKPHLKENIKTEISKTDKPTHISVVFYGFTPEQKKNIDDIADCLNLPEERVRLNAPVQKEFILEDVQPESYKSTETKPVLAKDKNERIESYDTREQ